MAKRPTAKAATVRNADRRNGKAWGRNSSRVSVRNSGTPFSRRVAMGWERSAVTGLYGPVMTQAQMSEKYGNKFGDSHYGAFNDAVNSERPRTRRAPSKVEEVSWRA